jgi:tRNA (guanine-N7-)-methyltransferase
VRPEREKDRQPKFYGRRKGKAIRQNRQSAYNLVMPWAELKLPEGEGKVDPRAFFDFPVEEVWLEIGFGNGEQLVHQALANPKIGLIGCEPFLNGVAVLCRDIRDNNIRNIRIWQEDARPFMHRLKDHSIGRCFLLNSDPWPKTRHHKRRFVQPETLDELHRLLKKGAEFRMSTDHPGLAAWQLEKTLAHPGFHWLADGPADWRERPADMEETRYQKKGVQEGRPTVFLRFSRV